MTRTSVENSTDVFCYLSSLLEPNRLLRACTKICLFGPTKGALLHEQKELRSSGKHRRCEFANGACERTANAKTLRKDRIASEWKDVAFATRRRRIYPMRNVVVYYTKV